MSIAVSAVVVPSRLLRAAWLAFGVANLGAAVMLVSGPGDRFTLAAPGAACCLLATLAILEALVRTGKPRRIDISGLGQIHLTVQLNTRTAEARREPVRLLSGSTVWPQFILLRLGAEDGAVTVMPIVPDSVSAGQFRGLAVALRAIAAQNNKLE